MNTGRQGDRETGRQGGREGVTGLLQHEHRETGRQGGREMVCIQKINSPSCLSLIHR